MSEETVTREEFETLQKALAVSQAENSITGYTFDEELNKAVAGAIATLDAEGKPTAQMGEGAEPPLP